MSDQYISDRKAHRAALGVAVCKINHDLRNILASAQLISDRLSQVEDPTVQRLAPRLIASLDRAIALCSSTVKYGQAHEAPPQRRRMALAPLVEEVADSLGLIDHREIDWANAVAPNIEIDADPDHLFRALLNLCRNAMAALDKTGRRRDGAICTIEVRDTGPGMPEKARACLFQPFQGSARPGGSGLGLAIAAELVRAHGGDIRLADGHAERVCFRLTIPDSGGEAEVDAEAAADKPTAVVARVIALRTRADAVRGVAGGETAAPALQPTRHRPDLWYPAAAVAAGVDDEGRERAGDPDILASLTHIEKHGDRQHPATTVIRHLPDDSRSRPR